jgi:Recombination endonuclease VII
MSGYPGMRGHTPPNKGTRQEFCGRGHRYSEHGRQRKSDGLRYCVVCHNLKGREWRAKHPDKLRRYKFKTLFGITPEEYDELLRSQSGVCAICGGEDVNGRNLSVDHDHASGKIRGLLCYGCNVSLGFFKDNAAVLRKAAAYIDKYKEESRA